MWGESSTEQISWKYANYATVMKKQSKSMTFQIGWKLLSDTSQASVFKIFAIYSMYPIQWWFHAWMNERAEGSHQAGVSPGNIAPLLRVQFRSTKINGVHYLLRVSILNYMLNTDLQGGKANALIALCQPLLPENSEAPYAVDCHSVKTHIQPYRHEWFSWDKTKPFQSYNSCCGYRVVSLWQAV